MNYVKEELKLLNMKKINKVQFIKNSPMVFEIEKDFSLAEKIEFIDSQHDGIATYLLELFEKWKNEKESLPQDQAGRPKTVSIKAWLRKNDSREIIGNQYKIGYYNLFGTSYPGMFDICPKTEYNRNLTYTGEPIAHQWFHDLLEILYRDEKQHFKATDPFFIKLSKVKQYGDKYGILFNNKELNDIVWNRKEDVLETNLDAYIDAYEKLEHTVNQIETELHDVVKIHDEL